MRIISLAPSNTEILYALGLADSIIGVSAFCDYPIKVKQKPIVGSFIAVNSQKLTSFKPDLVLTSTIVQENLAQTLKAHKLPVVHVNPTTLDGIYESIDIIGAATNTKRKAAKITATMKKQIEQSRMPKKSQNAPRVYIEEWHRPPYISGNWVPELVHLAGGSYALITSGVLSREVTTAEIIAYNPQVIILSICGFGEKVDKDMVKQRAGWEKLDAVKNKRVYVIDDTYLNRPGPRIYKAIPLLKRYIASSMSFPRDTINR